MAGWPETIGYPVGYVGNLGRARGCVLQWRGCSDGWHSQPHCFETKEGEPERCQETSWVMTIVRCDRLEGW